MVQRAVRRVLADDDDLSVVLVRVDDRQDIRVPARPLLERRFLPDGLGVYVVVEGEFDCDFGGDEFGTTLRQPDFAEPTAADAADERVNPICLPGWNIRVGRRPV